MMNEPIRIIHVMTRPSVGGSVLYAIQLVDGLNQLDYDCRLITGIEEAGEGSMKDIALARKLKVEVIPEMGREIEPRNDIVTLYKLYRIFRRDRPHIVHTHTSKAGLVGRLAARLAGVPIVLHTFYGHVFYGYFGKAKTRLFIELEKFGASLSDRIIAISDRQRDDIANYGVTSRDRIDVIPLGFDLNAFAAQTRYQGGFRHSLGLGKEVTMIATIGRMVKIKNLHLFLDAAALVYRKEPQFRFVLIGDGELRFELEAYAKTLGIEEAVIFTGWRSNLPPIYADLDAVIISSNNEGTPVSLIEGMASGVAAIATKVGGVPDIIEDGKTGRLVPPGDTNALANAILSIIREPEKTAHMAQQAREFALRKFHFQRAIADIDQLYKHLLMSKNILLTG